MELPFLAAQASLDLDAASRGVLPAPDALQALTDYLGAIASRDCDSVAATWSNAVFVVHHAISALGDPAPSMATIPDLVSRANVIHESLSSILAAIRSAQAPSASDAASMRDFCVALSQAALERDDPMVDDDSVRVLCLAH